MARLEWVSAGDKYYNSGVDRGVLNVEGTTCIPWSGLVGVEDSSEEREPDVTYYNGLKIYNSRKPSDYSGIIEAYYSPEEFDQCDGTLDVGNGLFTTNNSPKPFNFSWRSGVGPYDYRLHFVFNALSSPSDKKYRTKTNENNPEPLSWNLTTRPYLQEGVPKSSHFFVDTTKTNLFAIHLIEKALYGTESTTPKFPTPSDLQDFLSNTESVSITDLGDGRWQINAPDSVAKIINSVEQLFEIDWPGLDDLGNGIFRIRG